MVRRGRVNSWIGSGSGAEIDGGLVEFEDEDLAAGMEGASSGPGGRGCSTICSGAGCAARTCTWWLAMGAVAPNFIYLDTYMLYGVYQGHGICIRNHCGAEPPRDTEPAGLVTTVGGRDRASASYDAADRVKAPASAARGRFRGGHGGRTAPSLPAEARTTTRGGCLAGSVPPVLVRSRGCSP